MIKITIILSFILLQAGASFSQSLTKADYLEDLHYLKDTLPKRHINLFAKISKPDFDRQIAAIESGLTHPDEEAFIAELFKLIVAVGDEHTQIRPVFTKVLPIRFNKFTEGIYVTATDTLHADILLCRLSGVNGHAIAEVTNRFKKIIQSENPSYFEVGLLHFINNPVILKGLKITGSTDEVTFDLIAPDGKTLKRTIKSVAGQNARNMPLAEVKNGMLSQMNKEYYWYNYNPETGTLYFNYSRCQEQNSHPFSVFNDELFAAIAKNKPQRLVIDLRYNSGGNSAILEPFIERIRQSDLNSKQKLFVVIGKQTFSSALMNAVSLKKTTYATLLGEATSGNVNHYGEVRSFQLPRTKISVGYSTRYWENWKAHDGPLIPDISVTYSIKNFSKGIDEAIVAVNKKK